ncbi:MAG TPA: sec-independent translocase [Mycobacteriales bacterium]|nr:sec-independent translocase [Mycobacteriales bacterium]
MLGGLGWPETAVLLLLGLFLFGPERLPGLAADAGKALRRLRAYVKDMSKELREELGPEVADLDLRSLHPREIVRRNLFEDDDDEVVSAPRRTSLAPGETPPWDPDAT